MRPGVLLDRDGTIIVDYHYVGHIERVQFIPGAIDAIRRFNQHNIPVAIITNQGGVSRGFYPESNVHEVHNYIKRELHLHGAHVDLFLYSPYHPDGSVSEYAKEDHFHKPEPGMAQYAAMELQLDLHESFVVGDRITDVELARRIEADAIYLGTEPLPDWFSKAGIYHYPSLAAAAGYIIERITGVQEYSFPAMAYTGPISYFRHYSDEITTTLSRMKGEDISRAVDLLYEAAKTGDYVFIAGNGGAAAIANHMATDHIKHLSSGQPSLFYTNIQSLSANTALITAIANDIGYDAIFSAQLENSNAGRNDILVVFSVSGDSPNIVRALQCAAERGMNTIAIVAGGKAAGLADVTIHIPNANYGIAEDIMSIIQHTIAQYIRQTCMSDRAIQSARF